MKFFPVCAALFAACILTACGGGGGSGPEQPINNTSPIRDAIGGGPLALGNAQIRQALAAIQGKHDHLNISDSVAVCHSTGCRALNNVTIYLSDFQLENGTYEPVMTRHGFNVFQGANRITFLGDSGTYQTYGGWGSYTLFAGFASGDSAFAGIAGNDTGSRPVGGSATWTGVMVGGDFGRGEAFQGDASLNANFSAAHMNIVFTNIHEVTSGNRRRDISFGNVPFTSDGFYSGNRAGGDFVEGTFYGPNHVEVGGVFETDNGNTFGSFGAKRQ